MEQNHCGHLGFPIDIIMSPPTKGVGGRDIVFGTDPVGVSVGVKLLVRSVT